MEENERITANAGVGVEAGETGVVENKAGTGAETEAKLDRSLESHLQHKPTGGSGVQGHPGLG